MEQLVNQAAKHRYMSGGQVKVPLTVRTQGGRRLVAGRAARAAGRGMVRARARPQGRLRLDGRATSAACSGRAIYDDNPVVFFEHRNLYPLKEEVPDELEPIPLGKAPRAPRGRET